MLANIPFPNLTITCILNFGFILLAEWRAIFKLTRQLFKFSISMNKFSTRCFTHNSAYYNVH